MEINDILYKIIQTKDKELKKLKKRGIFEKINNFEGNAIGQIGEEFIKKLCKEYKISFSVDEGTVIHDEYDILINNKKVEIKTAKKGLKKDTCQFNGINPSYNHDYFILLGLEPEKAAYLIIKGNTKYIHRDTDNIKRGHYITVNNKDRKLVQMNPDNQVNYKLTLKFNELKDISDIVNDLKKIQ